LRLVSPPAFCRRDFCRNCGDLFRPAFSLASERESWQLETALVFLLGLDARHRCGVLAVVLQLNGAGESSLTSLSTSGANSCSQLSISSKVTIRPV
jgi:hypothetical protein